jgi:hypothetical protein
MNSILTWTIIALIVPIICYIGWSFLEVKYNRINWPSILFALGGICIASIILSSVNKWIAFPARFIIIFFIIRSSVHIERGLEWVHGALMSLFYLFLLLYINTVLIMMSDLKPNFNVFLIIILLRDISLGALAGFIGGKFRRSDLIEEESNKQ